MAIYRYITVYAYMPYTGDMCTCTYTHLAGTPDLANMAISPKYRYLTTFGVPLRLGGTPITEESTRNHRIWVDLGHGQDPDPSRFIGKSTQIR